MCVRVCVRERRSLRTHLYGERLIRRDVPHLHHVAASAVAQVAEQLELRHVGRVALHAEGEVGVNKGSMHDSDSSTHYTTLQAFKLL